MQTPDILLVVFLVLCLHYTVPAPIRCNMSNRECPDGTYCDLGRSKCLDCRTVCNGNSKLKHESQCKKECPDFAYLLTPNQQKDIHNTITRAQRITTPIPLLTGESTLRSASDWQIRNQPETKNKNPDVYAPTMYFLWGLLVAVVLLALGLVILFCMYLRRKTKATRNHQKKPLVNNTSEEANLMP